MSNKDRATVFSEVRGEGSRGNRHTLWQGKIQHDVKKRIFTSRVKVLLGDVHNWPGQSSKTPGLSLELALLRGGGWTGSPEIPPSLQLCAILRCPAYFGEQHMF